MKQIRQIIAIGGGGFHTDASNTLMEEYILAASGKEWPRICFLPTASGDDRSLIDAFYGCFGYMECIPTHLSLFRKGTMEKRFLLSQDIIYVGGGNTVNMLLLWKNWGVDELLLEAYNAGTLVCGVSAGSICWFEQGLTDSFPGALKAIDGLGILEGSNCPHFDGEPGRRPAYTASIQAGLLRPGIAVDDGCGLHYREGYLFKVVASVPGANAYNYTFSLTPGSLNERVIPSSPLYHQTSSPCGAPAHSGHDN